MSQNLTAQFNAQYKDILVTYAQAKELEKDTIKQGMVLPDAVDLEIEMKSKPENFKTDVPYFTNSPIDPIPQGGDSYQAESVKTVRLPSRLGIGVQTLEESPLVKGKVYFVPKIPSM